MSMMRNLFAGVLCVAVSSQAYALLSVNVLQDDTTVPGWVINTFTVDSDTDVTAALALSELSSGSMLQIPGPFTLKQSSGPGDSFININGDLNTVSGLGVLDLTFPDPAPPTVFDDTGIAMLWFNISTSDIGTDMHLATLTFSADTAGDLELWAVSGQGFRQNIYSITDGVAELTSTIAPRPLPDPPMDPEPLPEPDPGPGPGGDPPNDPPGTGGSPTGPGSGSPIPEPAGLGLFAVAAAGFGALRRRRLDVAGK
jgi:hypothetical protein